MKTTEEGRRLRYYYWTHWFHRGEDYPELVDIRIKVMLTLITIKPKPNRVTHVDLQKLFRLTDKTVRNMRTVLKSNGWTIETFVNRQVTIEPSKKAIDLFDDYIIGKQLPVLYFDDK